MIQAMHFFPKTGGAQRILSRLVMGITLVLWLNCVSQLLYFVMGHLQLYDILSIICITLLNQKSHIISTTFRWGNKILNIIPSTCRISKRCWSSSTIHISELGDQFWFGNPKLKCQAIMYGKVSPILEYHTQTQSWKFSKHWVFSQFWV